jgi:hypothetical protein
MSRGGLLLRCVKENNELNYIDAAALLIVAGNGRKQQRKSDYLARSSSRVNARELIRRDGSKFGID